MSTTSADLSRLAMVKLGVGDAQPANPAMLVARFNSETIAFTPNVITSPELDPSGQVRDSILTGASSAGAIEFPLVRSPWFHELLAAVFRSNWGEGNLGYPDPDNAGLYLQRALSADELIPGKKLFLYNVQKKFETPDTPSYHLFTKCAVNSLSLRVQPNEMLSGSAAMIGAVVETGTADIAGATYPDPGEYTPFTAPNVTEINMGSMSASACFNSLTLAFNSNVRAIDCIGALAAREKALGRFEPMIDGAMFFVSNDMLDALRDQDAFPVTVELTDGDGNKYEFFYPRCKLVTATVSIPGTNQDVMQPVSVRGHYDPDYGYSCKVTRTLA